MALLFPGEYSLRSLQGGWRFERIFFLKPPLFFLGKPGGTFFNPYGSGLSVSPFIDFPPPMDLQNQIRPGMDAVHSGVFPFPVLSFV